MKAVILLSGGLDSTVALWWAKKRGNYEKIYALTFTYGSKEEKVTVECTKNIARLSNIENHLIIDLPWLREFAYIKGSTLVAEEKQVPKFSGELTNANLSETAKSVWIPARNLCFIAIAASWAEALGEDVEIVTGFNGEEARTFPDNSKQFVERVNSLLKLAVLEVKVKVVAPLIDKDKRGICSLAEELGVPVEYTNSCYEPQGVNSEGKSIHCGKCESCTRRHRGFIESIGYDKTLYIKNSK
ncbi:MAG: 7-cyano-7-deazaguanine synthase QueC [Candidatus Lokiarchaeia archaeon]